MAHPPHYYNENDPSAAHWLRSLIAAGEIPAGLVDTRSIADVQPEELEPYVQCHFFAGIGGWSLAARLAGWPTDRPLWTGSCPCQPFSAAGKRGGTADERHLWPHLFRLIRAARPPVVVGEQVAGAAGFGWFDGVAADLEGETYACRAVDIPACAVDAPHIRQRIYWLAVADADRQRQPGRQERDERPVEPGERAPRMDDAIGPRVQGTRGLAAADGQRWRQRPGTRDYGRGDAEPQNGRMGDASRQGLSLPEQFAEPGDAQRGLSARAATPERGSAPVSAWADGRWITGADGKARRVGAGLRLLAHGVSGRVAQLRGLGNAIVPPLAAEVLAAYLDTVARDC